MENKESSKNYVVLNFIIGVAAAFLSIVILIPSTVIVLNFLGPGGYGSLVHRSTVDWGKGDPWTIQEPFICTSWDSQRFHCSAVDFIEYTMASAIFSLIIAMNVLLLPTQISHLFDAVPPDHRSFEFLLWLFYRLAWVFMLTTGVLNARFDIINRLGQKK